MSLRLPRVLLLSCVLALSGCAQLGYYAQAAHGHLALMAAARPIDQVRADPATPDRLAALLGRAELMRRFASDTLGLPDNASYTRYAELRRDFAVWSVSSTAEFSLELDTWCYPVIGCASYRGYFDESAALAYAERLRAEGRDVAVAGVSAYSTLGWFADPLLNTFVSGSELALAGLIFHELAHQRLYVRDDSGFNEAFATAVELIGVSLWIDAHGDAREREQWRALVARRASFLALLAQTRVELSAVYASSATPAEKRLRKRSIFADLQGRYLELRARWQDWPGYDRFFRYALGNANLAALGAYHDRVPGFLALFAQAGQDWRAFYAAAEALAASAPATRDAELTRLAQRCRTETDSLRCNIETRARESGELGAQGYDS